MIIYFVIFNIFTKFYVLVSQKWLYYQKFFKGNFTTIIYVNMSGKTEAFESIKILAYLRTMFVLESSRKRRTYSSSHNSWSLFWSLVASRYFLSSWKGVRVCGQSLLRLAGLPLTSITLITLAGMAIIKLFYANASRFRVTNEFFFFLSRLRCWSRDFFCLVWKIFEDGRNIIGCRIRIFLIYRY